MKYTIYSTGHNGSGDCRPYRIDVASLRAAKKQATEDAAGDRCHIHIRDETGKTVATRDAVDTFRGCCNGGWEPWEN